MRAVVYDGFGAIPQVREVPDPVAPPAGAVVRVEATGLCRSDWHGWMGHDPDIATFPHVPGHELAGVVHAVGDGVRRWRPGDRVTVPFVCGCGSCPSCRAGDHQVCERQTQPGFTHWGSFAQYTVIHHADVNLVSLPPELSYAAAAALGCRFATAYRAVTAQGRVAPGEWVAVYGCGGVGLSAVMIATAYGARVIAVDVSPGALALARSHGAVATVNSAESDPVEAVRELTGGGAHLTLDALGSSVTATAAILSLRRRGRHVQVGLLPSAVGDPALPMSRVIGYELEILGSHGLSADDYPELLRLVLDRIRPDSLVTVSIPLSGVPAALAAMGERPPTGITVIEPQRPE
ncbi:zinc-dependent alcohol dehydrogenase family protein [Catellatospora sp. KI3]|uniref:zinc-dependent alcohol dehydrogenase family protein n=1 Tax=Catellatospora sp. KI3 TaxID=3041620 RepID=UPI002482F2AF|nr:zinc-dependent alcohol dehydrogenase family protein [Catellatospora sp. KI3]MDI1461996.1 zinc-dependent alcohol dehydrogenase family protein [Catellatospora sp. KI3]